MYDVGIVGAGPAGITAAVYAARKGLDVLVLSLDIGGQAALSASVENYTGYQFITGSELANRFREHLESYKVVFKEEEVSLVRRAYDRIELLAKTGQIYDAESAIIATGKRPRMLNVEGEKEFHNRGVTYCATCDGPLFRDKDVAVIGGGNSALDAALQLVRIARKVYLVNATSRLSGDAIMQGRLLKSDKLVVLNQTKVKRIIGEKLVSAIEVESGGVRKVIAVAGVFIEIGLIPNSELCPDLEKNALGEIKVDRYNRTNIEGIFAAGDVTDVIDKQIIIAAAEGAKAALGVFRYLSGGR